ncbi:MAG: hypothetical protein K9K35_15485, partial [Rhodoferax sp.]|nr:hypothetical protein [Rhodoferax sp.]
NPNARPFAVVPNDAFDRRAVADPIETPPAQKWLLAIKVFNVIHHEICSATAIHREPRRG